MNREKKIIIHDIWNIRQEDIGKYIISRSDLGIQNECSLTAKMQVSSSFLYRGKNLRIHPHLSAYPTGAPLHWPQVYT